MSTDPDRKSKLGAAPEKPTPSVEEEESQSRDLASQLTSNQEELSPALQEPTQIRSGFAGGGSPEEAAWVHEQDEEAFREQERRAEARIAAQEEQDRLGR